MCIRDRYYHTDRDRIEMVSAATLANVGNCALSTGLLLTDGSPAIARAALSELTDVAIRELRTQATLSNAALKGGSTPAGERTILETWRDYYLSALGSMPDMSLSNDGLTSEIAAARAKVSGVASELLGALPR